MSIGSPFSSNGSVTYWRGSQSISLGQGERKLFAKEVTIPDYMLGSTVQFVVLAKTKSDLPLGNHAFEKITTSGTPSGLLLGDCSVTPRNATTSYTHNQGVDVHPQETILATCPVQNFSKKTITLHSVDLEVRRRSIFGDILEQKTIPLKESITLDANKKGSFSFTINPLDTPQAYHVLVSPASTSLPYNQAHFQYVTSGLSATIQNTKISGSTFEIGDTAKVFLYYTLSASNFPGSRYGDIKTLYDLSVTLKDPSGKECGTFAIKNTNPLEYVSVPITGKCSYPTAVVTLSDSRTGRQLDTRTIETTGTTNDPSLNRLQELHEEAIQEVIDERYPARNNTSMNIPTLIITLISLLGMLILILKKKELESLLLTQNTFITLKEKFLKEKSTTEESPVKETKEVKKLREKISLPTQTTSQEEISSETAPTGDVSGEEKASEQEPSAHHKKIAVVLLFLFGSIFLGGTPLTHADTVTFSDDGVTVWGCVAWNGSLYDGACLQYGWISNATNDYSATINLNTNTISQGSATVLTATPSFYAKWLGCSNVCDCFVQSTFNVNLQVKNPSGTPILTENAWKNNVLCDEQWIDGRPSGDCSLVAVTTPSHTTPSTKKPSYLASFFGIEKVSAAATATYGAKTVHPTPGTLTPGAYTATFNITANSTHGTRSTGSAVINLPFTVTPGTPTVTLNFSTF
jgi:hypothetical protein